MSFMITIYYDDRQRIIRDWNNLLYLWDCSNISTIDKGAIKSTAVSHSLSIQSYVALHT